MKIALYGYGKMGKAIAAIAEAEGHEVVLRVDRHNAGAAPTGADVAIEFSTPATVLQNIALCLQEKVPVVVGATGWYDHLDEVKALVASAKGSLLWSSNFSIGVQLFFRLNEYAAHLLAQQTDYRATIEETHHIHKMDAPSGTAISLADHITRAHPGYQKWAMASDAPGHPGAVPITSHREGEVPGTHVVSWASGVDRITLTHEAFGRDGFATGAVKAAEWLLGRRGFFTMSDLLDAP